MMFVIAAIFFAASVLILVGATVASVFVMMLSNQAELGRDIPQFFRRLLEGPVARVCGIHTDRDKVANVIFRIKPNVVDLHEGSCIKC